MRYRLIVLTHGGDSHTPILRNTLGSFEEMVTPQPAEKWLVEDGEPKTWEFPGFKRVSTGVKGPHGYCSACEVGWEIAAVPGVDFVYWLEYDFLHERPVNLLHLAWVLLKHTEVAQMSLMRQPVNEQEVKAGGIVKASPDEFVSRRTDSARGGRHSWLEQGKYWTTNPALFRRQIADRVEWPLEDGCEGRVTVALRHQGYSFGIWGSGEEWVRHVGVRSGFGY